MSYNQRRSPKSQFVKVTKIDYKDIHTLQKFILENGRIIPGRITGVKSYQQRKIAKAIKVARFLALLPYSDRQLI
jgi:small subunit ribosomal protein S18